MKWLQCDMKFNHKGGGLSEVFDLFIANLFLARVKSNMVWLWDSGQWMMK